MEQNTMLIILLSLLFYCDLLYCANIKAPLRTDHKDRTRRNDNFTNNSITEVLSNIPGTHKTYRITPQFSHLKTPLGNGINTHDTAPSLPSSPSPFVSHSSVPASPIHQQDSSLRSPSNSPPDLISASTSVNTTYIPILTGISFSSNANVERSFVSVSPPGCGSDPVSYPAETPPINFDPSVAEFAKKWLHGIASTTVYTSTLLVQKLSKVFDYDHTNQGIPLAIRRQQKESPRKISNRQLKNNAFRQQTQATVHHGITVPQIPNRRHPEAEAKTFWHDPPKEFYLRRSKRAKTITTVTKKKLKPDLLLGRATISAVKNTEDVEGYEKVASRNDGMERIMRMHRIHTITRKQWYSDRTEVQTELVEITAPTTEKHYLRHIEASASTTQSSTHTSDISTASTHTYDTSTVWTHTSDTSRASTDTSDTSTVSTTQFYSPMEEGTRPEGYMMVFLIELTQLVATKEKTAVHDVLKHTSQIIQGFYKSGQLQWLGEPLIDVTRTVAKMLKNSELDILQKQAADLQHTLRQRHQMLSGEVNAILETADSLYADDDGAHLLEVLKEFVAYPHTTLSSYWLCTSLINNFLRPYRRLADTRQRQQLMDSVNKALKTRFTLGGTNDSNALRSGGVRQVNVPDDQELPTHKEPPYDTTRNPGGRKRKRHHRSRKRKRERKLYRMHGEQRERDNKNLMLRSMTRGTSLHPSDLVTI